MISKELKVLWTSPIPYVLGIVFNVIVGALGTAQLVVRGQSTFAPIVPIAGFLLIIAASLLTSRSIAEERKNSTLDLLLSMDVGPVRIAYSKLLANWLTLFLVTAPVTLFAVLLFAWSEPDVGPILTALLGLTLFGGALVGLSLLASSLTGHQAAAALISVFASLALWFAHAGTDTIAGLGALSFSERLRAFAGGVVDIGDVAYFASLIALGVVGSAISIARR